MIATPDHDYSGTKDDQPAGLVVVDIGNSAVHLGVWSNQGVEDVRRLDHGDSAGLAQALAEMRCNSLGVHLAAAVVVCVVSDALPAVEAVIRDDLQLNVVVVGRDIPLPLKVAVNHPEQLGGDRVCAAAAAYDKVGGTCTVIDFGTAVTVDLVDDAGVFQGGAILPGLRLQTLALGDHTAALPVVSVEFPEQPVGRETTEAIRSGICHGLVGAVRNLVEQFATRLNRWPYVVATGGDADLLVGHCDFIDSTFHHLCLQGVGLAYVKYLNARAGET